MDRPKRLVAVSVVAGLALAGVASCSGAGGGGGSKSGSKTINVLMVNNPQMLDIQKLTKDSFTKDTGINVNYTVLPENDLRSKVTTEFTQQSGQYDVATISNFEVPIYSKRNWLEPLDSYIAKDPSFDQNDILPAMANSLKGSDGKIYAEPFYGESSFLMYRKDVFAKKGLTMPERPTWDQVASLAAKVDGAQPGMKGICLRGQIGWGQVFAPLTTVVNTFGGTWFTKDWQAQVNSKPFVDATNFYVNLVRAHGEAGAPQAGFSECLAALSQGKVAMWYDATSAAGSLEDPKSSKAAGKLGYVQAPVKETKSSGWSYAWAWGLEKAGKNKDNAAKFALWASSKQYEKLVGDKLGYSRVPAGKRASTYEIPAYQKAAAPFYKQTLEAIKSADPANPGVQPRPTVGIQFVDIPEFTALGDEVSQGVSAAIAGKTTVKAALDKGQAAAEKVGKKYQ